MKIRSKNSLYPHRHFTEQLVDTFEKPPQKSNLNHETSKSFDPVTQKLYRLLRTTIHTQSKSTKQSNNEKWHTQTHKPKRTACPATHRPRPELGRRQSTGAPLLHEQKQSRVIESAGENHLPREKKKRADWFPSSLSVALRSWVKNAGLSAGERGIEANAGRNEKSKSRQQLLSTPGTLTLGITGRKEPPSETKIFCREKGHRRPKIWRKNLARAMNEPGRTWCGTKILRREKNNWNRSSWENLTTARWELEEKQICVRTRT
jgi:hypothetical protein